MRRKARRSVPWLLAIVMIVAAPVLAQSVEIVTFETYPINPPYTSGVSIDPDFYSDRGVQFAGGTVLQYEEGFTSSGRNGLEMCYSQEFCATPFHIDFDTGQQRVAVWVGYSGTLDEPGRVLMVAFDSDGARVDVDELILESDSPVLDVPELSLDELTLGLDSPALDVPELAVEESILGPDSLGQLLPELALDELILELDSLVRVGTELVVEDPAGRIAAVEIRWSDANRSMNSLVIDDLQFEAFLPVLELSADPIPHFLASNEPVEENIVVTNIGNVAVDFFATLDDPAGAFELIGNTCNGGLAPGNSCELQVRFSPPEPGEYPSEAILSDPTGAPILVVPVTGTQPLREVTPTTVTPTTITPTTITPTTITPTTITPPTTAPPVAVAPTTAVSAPVAVEAASSRRVSSDEDGVAVMTLPLLLVVAIGGTALLIRRQRTRPPKRRKPSDGALSPTPTVTVTPHEGSSEITTHDRQPVTAIRIAVNPDRTKTTLTEENPS